MLCLSLYLLRHYGDIGKSWPVTLVVLTAWFFSFSIVLVVPLDVSAAFYLSCVRDWVCSNNGNGAGGVNVNGDVCVPGGAAGEQEVAACMAQMADTSAGNSGGGGGCECKAPGSFAGANVLPVYWQVAYWTSQLLTWLILPLMASYLAAGEFSAWLRFKGALRSNALL